MSTAQTKKRKPSTTKQFGLRTTPAVAEMIRQIRKAEGHVSDAAAVVQAIRDKHQRLIENGQIARPGER